MDGNPQQPIFGQLTFYNEDRVLLVDLVLFRYPLVGELAEGGRRDLVRLVAGYRIEPQPQESPCSPRLVKAIPPGIVGDQSYDFFVAKIR
jgi:hypothetical protein